MTLFVVAPGIGALLGMLVKLGGGALGLAVARGVVQLGGWALCIVSKWLLLADGTALVSCFKGLVTCVLTGDCQGGEGHVWLTVVVVGVAMCNVRFGSECARCNSLRRQVTKFSITVHPL